jgi:hypothetical protein
LEIRLKLIWFTLELKDHDLDYHLKRPNIATSLIVGYFQRRVWIFLKKKFLEVFGVANGKGYERGLVKKDEHASK